MHVIQWMKPAVLLAFAVPALAADVDVRVILQGDVRPGVYGRVDFGAAPPPPPTLLVYEKPVVIVHSPPRPVPVQPVYLHVPPGHAKDWRKHCKKYNACGVPVYFVKSEEYESKKKGKKPKKEG